MGVGQPPSRHRLPPRRRHVRRVQLRSGLGRGRRDHNRAGRHLLPGVPAQPGRGVLRGHRAALRKVRKK